MNSIAQALLKNRPDFAKPADPNRPAPKAAGAPAYPDFFQPEQLLGASPGDIESFRAAPHGSFLSDDLARRRADFRHDGGGGVLSTRHGPRLRRIASGFGPGRVDRAYPSVASPVQSAPATPAVSEVSTESVVAPLATQAQSAVDSPAVADPNVAFESALRAAANRTPDAPETQVASAVSPSAQSLNPVIKAPAYQPDPAPAGQPAAPAQTPTAQRAFHTVDPAAASDLPEVLYESAHAAPAAPVSTPRDAVYPTDQRFIPVDDAAPAAASGRASAPALPRIEGIFWDSERPMALIDGEIVEVGTALGNIEVVEIHRTRVVLNVNGQRRTLSP